MTFLIMSLEPAPATTYWMSVRLACSMAGVDASTVKLGAAGEGALEDLGWWMGWLSKLPIVIDDDPADARTMARRVREHQREFAKGSARRADGELHPKCRLRTVLADHVQKLARLCSGCGPRADTKERIAAVSHGWLHHVAKGLDVATVLLAQVRRDVLDAQRGQKGRIVFPRAAHLEGASELGQDADTIAIVHRPELPLLEADEEVPAKWLDVAAVVGTVGIFLAVLVRRILDRQSPGRSIELTSEVSALFAHYHWPGNVRQLFNVLRTACVMAGPYWRASKWIWALRSQGCLAAGSMREASSSNCRA